MRKLILFSLIFFSVSVFAGEMRFPTYMRIKDKQLKTAYGQELFKVVGASITFSMPIGMTKHLQVEEIQVLTKGLKSNGNIRSDKDVRIELPYYGTVLTSTSNYKYMVWVDDNGNLFTTRIAASPEISQEERVSLINQKMVEVNEARKKYKAINKQSTTPADLLQRIEVLETMLGIK